MMIDFRPLVKNREFRLLYLGQTVSFFGNMLSYVAIPYQLFQLTRSSWLVGALGIVQLVPLLIMALLGGAKADRGDRRKIMISCELLMFLGVGILTVNSLLPHPSVVVIFLCSAFLQGVNGFHRPAMDALTQNILASGDFHSLAGLNSLRYNFGAILGPALGGMLLAWVGPTLSYSIDALTFLGSTLALYLMAPLPPLPAKEKAPPMGQIKEGLQFALSRPELLGTYIVDIVAMTFAFPTALFPALGEKWGGAQATGFLYSGMSVGALLLTLTSGWTKNIKAHGAAVVWSAGLWGFFILLLGWAPNLPLAILCLALAGAADAVSAIFRSVIWNETIPNDIRGRLSGIEMISYMSGPLLGNARAGGMAAMFSPGLSILFGGILCVVGVVVCAYRLPAFYYYRSRRERESWQA